MKTEIEVSTEDSWSGKRKFWNFFRCLAVSLFWNNVIWLHEIISCTHYLRLNHCIICSLDRQRFWWVHNFVSLLRLVKSKTIYAGGTYKILIKYVKGLRRVSNSILVAIKKEFYVPKLHTESSMKRTRTQLKEPLRVGGVRWILEEKI